MWWGSIVHYLLTIIVLTLGVEYEERKSHRLIGGHLKIFHEDPHDTELLIALSSGSKDKKLKKSDDDEKKTLSQQVADGKYGLIQKELFKKPIKPPGLISYESNPEVPKDNINSLGGLNKNDIWLAENHLLVLKGGSYGDHDDKNDHNDQIWPAIDDYKAPLRQVKIPLNPKVPPPFPVQLTENGPLQILGTNYTRTFNGTFDEGTYPIYANVPENFETNQYYPTDPAAAPPPPPPPNPYTTNFTSRQNPFANSPFPPGEYNMGAPFLPYHLNGTLPPYFASLPPGAVILPPPGNQTITDLIDEDDPSIYYPPPYTFFYPKDNSSIIPPGPLVPGIILPPPPNFFGLLGEITTKKYKKIKTTTPYPKIQSTPITFIETTTKLPITTTLNPVKIYPIHTPSEINNELKPVITTTPLPLIVTILPVNRHKNRTNIQQSVTILKPVKTTKPPLPSKYYVFNTNELPPNKAYQIFGTAKIKSVISTTQIPLKAYYSTSNEIETNSITQSPNSKYQNRIPKTTRKLPTQYFYYEEEANEFQPPPPPPPPQPQPPPPQLQLPQPSVRQLPPKQYFYVTSKPQRPNYKFIQQQKQDSQRNSDTFRLHIARLQKHIQQYYTTTKPNYRNHSPKPVYQFSFQAANYRPTTSKTTINHQYHQQNVQLQDKFQPIPKYSVEIQPAIEIIPTPQPPQTIYYQQKQQQQQQQQQNQQLQQNQINNHQNYQNTEKPVASKYYTTKNPVDYEYEDIIEEKLTSRPISQYSFESVTRNPIYKPPGAYYTKSDETYFDDNTKNYFSTFGKKLQSTTPLPIHSTIPPQHPQSQSPSNIKQNPISLHRDTLINYLRPHPQINPNAEYIVNSQRINYENQPPQQHQQQQQQQLHRQNIINQVNQNHQTTTNGGGSFISYQLPGDDGAHFYFLTPQLAQRRSHINTPNDYYYQQQQQQQQNKEQDQQQQSGNLSRIRRNQPIVNNNKNDENKR